MPRRLTLVVHSLAMGGAERVVALMANHWAACEEAVTVVTLDSPANDTYALHPAVYRVGLGLMGESRNVLDALWNNVRRVRCVRRAIRESRPQAVISAVDQMNVVTLMACRGLGVPVFIAEHTDPRRHRIGPVWSLLRRCVYPRCAALVVLTERIGVYARRFVRGRPIYVIPNPVDPRGLGCPADGSVPTEPRKPRIVALGRLAAVKGFDMLIEAFAQIAHRHPEWTLEIFGAGPLRADLQRLIDERKLGDRIRLPGWADEPGAVLRTAEVFVLSSRYEGFPNALLEAMACGAAVVAFDCDSGPAEIIEVGRDGLLVPPDNVPALAAALDGLLQDPVLRRRLGQHAVQSVARFSPERFFEQWETVLEAAGGAKSQGRM